MRRVLIQGKGVVVFLICSKKNVAVRRQELLDFISGDLLQLVADCADELVRDASTVQVVQEILLNSRGLMFFMARLYR